MKEKDFQRWVMDVARRLGWKVWHVPAPMQWDASAGRGFVGARDAAGLADLIMVRREWLVFAEIKGTDGKLSDRQVEFLGHINCMGNSRVFACAWKPGNEGIVEEILARPEAALTRP